MPETAPEGQGDQDLLLTNRATSGLQSVSRTYRPLPGTRAVTIRYRFGSYEVVTGQYYPDTLSVRLRSLTRGLEASEIGTVQSLAAHFNGATGVTAWRTRTIPVSDDSETIVVELAVANAIDLAHESYILVDSVADVQYAIPTFELFEYKNVVSGATLDPLTYLSVSPHYFNAPTFSTRINGTLTVTGPAEDALSDLQLEIVDPATQQTVARAFLTDAARTQLLNRPFGSAGVSFNLTQPRQPEWLFLLPPGEAEHLNDTTNGELILRAKAWFTSGRAPRTKVFARRVIKLARYQPDNRWNTIGDNVNCDLSGATAQDRQNWGNPPYFCGGDGWALPSIVQYLAGSGFATLQFNDFSNMNGGRFPPHRSVEHQTGIAVDARFADPSLQRRDRAHARALIELVCAQPRIQLVGITQPDAFQDEVSKAQDCQDGRRPAKYIKNWPDHTGHFHLVAAQ